MGVFQGTAEQIASKGFVKNEVTAFKNGAGKQMVEQRVPKLPIGGSAPYENVIAVYESGQVDENGLPLDAEYRHIPIEQEEIGIFPGFIVKRKASGNIATDTPIDDLDCANKKYVDEIVGDIENLLGGI